MPPIGYPEGETGLASSTPAGGPVAPIGGNFGIPGRFPQRYVFASKVLGGICTPLPLTDKTGYMTLRAPGKVRKLQVIVSNSVNTADVFKGSFAVGAAWGDGMTLKNAAGADLVPTALTWGTTDPNDFSNPGGGAATASITGVTGAEATYNLTEGRTYSDWMTVTPVDRTDYPGVGNPVTVRLYSAGNFPGNQGNYLPGSSDFGPNWVGAGEAEFQQGYSFGDDTGVAVPTGADNDSPYGLSVGVRFLLDTPGQSHICAGDSTMQGYGNELLISQGSSPGGIGGYVRKVRNWQIDRGVVSSLLSEAKVAERSTLYLRRMLPQIMQGRYTHAWIQPWSINETGVPTASPFNIEECLDLTLRILSACDLVGTKPILVEAPTSAALYSATVQARLTAFLDNAEAAGIATLRCPGLIGQPNGAEAQPYTLDGVHLTEVGYQRILAHIVARRDYYNLV